MTAKTILVATDLSAPARHAVERAYRLATNTDCELYLLHVMELSGLDTLHEMLGGNMFKVKAALNSDAHVKLRQLTGDPAIHRGVSAQTCVADGNPLDTIASEVDALDADLVVLGARGESFLRHTMLGSTAMRLVRKSTLRPALVVKQAPHEDYRSVVVAIDFSPVSLQAIRLARSWAPCADLVLLHAFELPYEGKLTFAGVEEQVIRQYVTREGEVRRKRLHELANSAGLTALDYSVRITHGDAAQQIILLEQEVDADLIVAGKHGTHVAEDLLLGSVTKHVLAESQCDVMVICDPRTPPEDTP